jgi:hypothetical protein
MIVVQEPANGYVIIRLVSEGFQGAGRLVDTGRAEGGRQRRGIRAENNFHTLGRYGGVILNGVGNHNQEAVRRGILHQLVVFIDVAVIHIAVVVDANHYAPFEEENVAHLVQRKALNPAESAQDVVL